MCQDNIRNKFGGVGNKSYRQEGKIVKTLKLKNIQEEMMVPRSVVSANLKP